MGIKHRNLGVIPVVREGDVVCFSMEMCIELANRIRIDVDWLIHQYQGVKCEFQSDGGYSVTQVVAVQDDGSTFDVVLIGADIEHLERFLNEGEPTFHEFVNNHPRANEIGKDENFNGSLFHSIAYEHRRLMRKNVGMEENDPNQM